MLSVGAGVGGERGDTGSDKHSSVLREASMIARDEDKEREKK